MTPPPVGLGEIPKGTSAKIVAVEAGDPTRFLQMGLLEGAIVELLHEAPFGGDPIAIRVRGTLIALRRTEANHIRVIPQE